MPRNRRQPARPHFISFSSFAISCPIFLILSLKIHKKNFRPLRDESYASCFHPNSYIRHRIYLKRFQQTPALYRELPGRPTVLSARLTQKRTSSSSPCPLALSGLAATLRNDYSFLPCQKLFLIYHRGKTLSINFQNFAGNFFSVSGIKQSPDSPLYFILQNPC